MHFLRTSNIQNRPILRIKAHLQRHHKNNPGLHRHLEGVYVHCVAASLFHFFESKIAGDEKEDGDEKTSEKDEPESFHVKQ